jgi:4-diphosphocytidyl-2-C-methyl-D-erythritol kinase
VYAEADRLGLHRERAELDELHGELHAALDFGTPVPTAAGLSHNDLQQAAISLCPAIDEALDQARDSGADVAFVSGSGPTVIGLFTRANALARAERAAAGLAGREPAPVVATPVGARRALPWTELTSITSYPCAPLSSAWRCTQA